MQPCTERHRVSRSSCPSAPSGLVSWILAEIEWKKKRLEEEDEFEDLTDEAKSLQEQELEKVSATQAKKQNIPSLFEVLRAKRKLPAAPRPCNDLRCSHPDPVQPGSAHPEGREGKSCSLSQEDPVAAWQNTHAHQWAWRQFFTEMLLFSCLLHLDGSHILPFLQVCLPVLQNLHHTAAQAWPEWVLRTYTQIWLFNNNY